MVQLRAYRVQNEVAGTVSNAQVNKHTALDYRKTVWTKAGTEKANYTQGSERSNKEKRNCVVNVKEEEFVNFRNAMHLKV